MGEKRSPIAREFWNFLKFAEFLKFHEILDISVNFMKFQEFRHFCENGIWSAPAPAPARSVQTEVLGSGQRSAPGRTGARPRGHGNPAPSRRESGPEPTEIRPRADGNPAPSRRKSCPDPDPLPPFKNTYLTHFPFGWDARRPPLTPICPIRHLTLFAIRRPPPNTL